jgi:C1A family cysteine protease
MSELTVQAVQAAIQKKNLPWTAAETPLSSLSEAEQNARLGLKPDKAQMAATRAAIKALGTMGTRSFGVGAPPSVDWRSNGGNFVTPIKDQQSCGSCVSFGTAATLESRIRIACKNAAMEVDLAEAHLFYCGCGNCCDTGWDFGPALDFATNTGVAQESAFPYTPGNQPCPSGLTPYIKIQNWSQVLSISDRKNVLANKGPVVGGLAVYADFFSYKSGVYHVSSTDLRGYHAISVVGYDDTLQCWICKNSWGAGWGDGGFFKIGYGQSGMDTDFAFYDANLTCPQPVDDDCKKYVRYLTQVITVARSNAQLRNCLRYYVCGIGRRPMCQRAVVQVVKNVLTILTHCGQYRKPFCAALA